MRALRFAGLLALAMVAALFTVTTPAQAAYPGTPGSVAFVRGGNIFIAAGSAAPVQVTTGGKYLWPRWAPNGGELAYLYKADLYIGFVFDNTLYSEQRLTVGGNVGAASWSPDGTQLAYIQTLTFPVLNIAHLSGSEPLAVKSALKVEGALKVASVTSKRVGAAVKPATAFVPAGFSSLWAATAVAWSPNGEWIAFPGGDCSGIQDECLSVVDVATNVQRWITGFSGAGNTDIGFDTVPAWTADSAHLLWTQQVEGGEANAPIGPKQIWETDPWGADKHQVGSNGDSISAPSPAADGSMIVTADHGGTQWITKVSATNHHTYLYKGYQADWGPVSAF